MLITTIIGYLFLANKPNNYLFARTIGILIALILTIVFYYTYTGIIGYNIDIINIIIFFVSLFIGELISSKLLIFGFDFGNKLSIILVVLLILFMLFTYIPPQINLFKDPITNTFGIN